MSEILSLVCGSKQPQSQRAKDDNYLLGFIKQFWLESGCVYGYRKIYKDLRASGDQCGRNRVLRLMKQAKIQSQRGYKRKNKYQAGEVSAIAPTCLTVSLMLLSRTRSG
jgi:putative transposase